MVADSPLFYIIMPNMNNNKRPKNGKRNLMRNAPLAKLSGQGDYFQTMKSIGKALKPLGQALKPVAKQALIGAGGVAGDFLGSKVGMAKQGASTGKMLAAKLSRLIGTGDYTVLPASANSLLPSPGQKSAYATFQDQTFGTRVSHREYIRDILTGPTAGVFAISQFPMNPSIVTSFPYLAPIAQNFEEYIVKGLVFEFISTTSPYNANSAMGSVIMTCEYNAALPSFTTKAAMENSEFALSGRFDQSLMYGVECASNAQNAYYCRGQPGMAELPLTTTDLGDFYIATAPAGTFPVNSVIGELWVSYDIEFRRPRLSGLKGGYYRYSSVGSTVTGTAVINVSPLVPSGTIQVLPTTSIQNGSLSTIGYVSSSSNTLNLSSVPVGENLLVTYVWTGNFTSSIGQFTTIASPTATNASFVTVYNNNTLNQAASPTLGQQYYFQAAATVNAQVTTQIIVTVTGTNATLTPPQYRWSNTSGSVFGAFDVLIADIGQNYSP